MKTVCILVAHNDADTLIAHLQRIRSWQCFDRILVVDNASEDATRVRVGALQEEKIELLEADRNLGYGAGNDLGLLRARQLGARFALIANPDTIYTEETVQTLCRLMEHRPQLAVCAPLMILSDADSEQRRPGSRANVLRSAPAWPLRPWLYELLEAGPVCRRIFRRALHYPESFYRGKQAVCVGAVPGSLLLADVEKVLSAGSYDKDMFLYGEENLLGMRLQRAGWKTALCLKCSYIHDHRAGKPDLSRQILREKSTLYYFIHTLGVTEGQELLARLFFLAVRAETWIAGRKRRRGKS